VKDLSEALQGALPEGVSKDLPTPPEGWAERDRKIQAARDETEQRLREEADRTLRTRLVEWGVPSKDVERVVVSTGSQLVETAPLIRVRKHTSGILVLAGTVGCGKTTAAAWWLAQEQERHPYLKTGNPLFVPTFRLERMSRYNDDQMKRVERARRLVLDDIGTEFLDTKGNFVALLRGLVDARYSDDLPMVITTNLGLDDFRERYGERTYDRLKEVGAFSFSDVKSLRGQP
jgi:DNA replication protein DnaC